MADSGDGQPTVVKTGPGSTVSRPLKTGRSFVLVLPDERVVHLRWDKALYDPGDVAQLTVEGRNLGREPLEVRVEQEERGSWALAASLRAQVDAGGKQARSTWTVPEGIERFRFKLRTSRGREVISGVAAAKPRRVLAIEGPKTFRLCEPATFGISKYQGKPTEADKDGRLRWFVRDAATGDDLLKADAGAIQQKGDKLEIDCVPFGWHDRTVEVGAQFDAPPRDKMFSGKPQSCELYDWIALVKKAEAEFPSLTGVQMTDAMRQIAGYDTDGFRLLYGGRPPATVLKPHGALTQTDLDQLENWTSHGKKAGKEAGILEDPAGNKLAAGHVLTGLSAGVYRDRSLDPTPAPVLPFGERVDNLYATTVAGDLGQVAIFVLRGKQPKPYLGSHGDATEAELIGDIDGWLLGEAEPKGGSGKALSETLLGYYFGCKAARFDKRYSEFSSKGMGDLENQVIRFATNYAYVTIGPWSGMNANVDPDSKAAVAEFKAWLGKK